MAHITSVYMVVLMQPDMQKAHTFYKNLGLQEKTVVPGKWIEFDVNGVTVALCPVQDTVQRGYSGFVLQTDDIYAMHKKLSDDGIQWIVAPTVATHGIMASFVDVGGNQIDLYQPTHEKVREVLQKKTCKKEDKCCKKKAVPSFCSEQ